MMVFVLARRRTEAFTDEQFAPLLEAEAEACRRMYAEGVVRAAYSRHDVPGAVLVLEVASLDDAKRHAESLPLGAKKMLEFTYVPVGGYRGFGPRT